MKAALERAQALAAGAPKPVPTMPIAGVSMANQIQEQKKKMLWGAKKQEKAAAESFNQWEATAFNDDDGGAKRAKFLKLMGAAKGAGPVPPAPAQGQAGPAPRADAALSGMATPSSRGLVCLHADSGTQSHAHGPAQRSRGSLRSRGSVNMLWAVGA
jgi:hypothetical protein